MAQSTYTKRTRIRCPCCTTINCRPQLSVEQLSRASTKRQPNLHHHLKHIALPPPRPDGESKQQQLHKNGQMSHDSGDVKNCLFCTTCICSNNHLGCVYVHQLYMAVWQSWNLGSCIQIGTSATHDSHLQIRRCWQQITVTPSKFAKYREDNITKRFCMDGWFACKEPIWGSPDLAVPCVSKRLCFTPQADSNKYLQKGQSFYSLLHLATNWCHIMHHKNKLQKYLMVQGKQ